MLNKESEAKNERAISYTHRFGCDIGMGGVGERPKQNVARGHVELGQSEGNREYRGDGARSTHER